LIKKLLKIGNPQFWGQIYNITLKSGLLKRVKLIRVNWTMKYGQVVGTCHLLENKTEIKINFEDILEIELYKTKLAILKTDETKPGEKAINISTTSKQKREFIDVDID
jgi:hypothetical protein